MCLPNNCCGKPFGKLQYQTVLPRVPKYFYITKRARNLVWALLIQGILNDDKLSELCERYGTSLAMEVNYNNYLKNMASTKIRFIIDDEINDGNYQNSINEENYGARA